MPRLEAPATSMVLTPAPARTISASGPASSIASVTWVERTTSTGALDALMAATSESPLDVRLVDRFASGGLQAVEARLLKLVGN